MSQHLNIRVKVCDAVFLCCCLMVALQVDVVTSSFRHIPIYHGNGVHSGIPGLPVLPYPRPTIPTTTTVNPPSSSSDDVKQVVESFHVETDIRFRFATTRMSSVIRNVGNESNELTFGLTLPKEAFIVKFSMMIDGKDYEGEVKEKMAAKKQYHEAVMKGQSAGHIRQKPRHANRFDVSVNVAGGNDVNFTLVYQELLPRKLGLYEYEMHVDPGQAVNDFSVKVTINENKALKFIKIPKLRKDATLIHGIEALNDLTVVERPNDRMALVTYRPSLSEQGPEGLSARFVVQYDVEHSSKGELLVADGYFIHLFTPNPSKHLPKDIAFVLDVSGSMMGTKLYQMKQAMDTILDSLMEEDRFNIITFSEGTKSWSETMKPANMENVEQAKLFVERLQAGGGTNINTALLDGLEKLDNRESQRRAGMIFFLTDGQPTEGVTNANSITENVKGMNDGKPIYSLGFGEGADLELLKTISAQNSGFARKIYEASDAALQVEELYKEISVVSMKNVSIEYLPGIVKNTTKTVFPVVNNGSEIFIGGCIDLRFLKRDFQLDNINNNNNNNNDGNTVGNVLGVEEEGDFNFGIDIEIIEEFEIMDPVIILEEEDEGNDNNNGDLSSDYTGIMEKMWAFLTIKQLLLEKDGLSDKTTSHEALELHKKILDMSLKYKFVTPLTSMVVTKPDSDSPMESSLQDVDKINQDNPRMDQFNSNRRAKSFGKASPSFGSGRQRGRHSRPYASSTSFRRHQLMHSSSSVVSNDPVGPTGASGFSGLPGLSPLGPVRVPTVVRKHKKSSKKGGPRKKNRTNRRKNKVKRIILTSFVFETDNSSLCLVPKKFKAGKYVLAQVNNETNVELEIECLGKRCGVVPKTLIFTIGPNQKQVSLNMSEVRRWEYKGQHLDLDVMIGSNDMTFTHNDLSVVVSRMQKRRRVFYTLKVVIKNSGKNAFSGMLDIINDKRIRQTKRIPRQCKTSNAQRSTILFFRKALKYKAD